MQFEGICRKLSKWNPNLAAKTRHWLQKCDKDLVSCALLSRAETQDGNLYSAPFSFLKAVVAHTNIEEKLLKKILYRSLLAMAPKFGCEKLQSFERHYLEVGLYLWLLTI